ncbi:CcdB family protein [Salipiger sp. 1_MG-2023]|uniref:CcdB family protein n=1 Tax=Salipiger sp. 1_MG-2023 TaxID=3062665 RepID=UPI0026E1622F|nr:CcdB family protein [Salipiger sp. 1_MG-2023]MDO6587493.1 CcdB family protein [Salipiger sp. 1_MG-2023]
MTQFHVHRLPGGRLVLDLQTDLIDTGTRVVAPLIPRDHGPMALDRLEPLLKVAGIAHVLHTAEMAAVPSSLLEQPAIADLSSQDYEIRRALDMVFSGF